MCVCMLVHEAEKRRWLIKYTIDCTALTDINLLKDVRIDFRIERESICLYLCV